MDSSIFYDETFFRASYEITRICSTTLDVWVQGLDAYNAVRGREQQLIDLYGGVGNPMVGNSRRGVGYYNPVGRFFHGMSNIYFGPLAPYTGF